MTVFARKLLPLVGSKYLTQTVHLKFSSTAFGLAWRVKKAQLLTPAVLVLSKRWKVKSLIYWNSSFGLENKNS